MSFLMLNEYLSITFCLLYERKVDGERGKVRVEQNHTMEICDANGKYLVENGESGDERTKRYQRLYIFSALLISHIFSFQWNTIDRLKITMMNICFVE